MIYLINPLFIYLIIIIIIIHIVIFHISTIIIVVVVNNIIIVIKVDTFGFRRSFGYWNVISHHSFNDPSSCLLIDHCILISIVMRNVSTGSSITPPLDQIITTLSSEQSGGHILPQPRIVTLDLPKPRSIHALILTDAVTLYLQHWIILILLQIPRVTVVHRPVMGEHVHVVPIRTGQRTIATMQILRRLVVHNIPRLHGDFMQSTVMIKHLDRPILGQVALCHVHNQTHSMSLETVNMRQQPRA
mmetsp:Transcript_2844/g.3263  ORF Transcript_2844/g.3263 Transcript_2844/m.3263 type:complete len:245 (+) Transcript_2844:87-821(+)